jgi:hypothetical protein
VVGVPVSSPVTHCRVATSQLVPDPSAVADLVVRMTRLPWPSGAADRDRYFAELGLVNAGPAGAPRNDPDTQWRRLTTPLSGVVDASISLFRGELLGIHLTCYNQRQDNSPPGAGRLRSSEAAAH